MSIKIDSQLESDLSSFKMAGSVPAIEVMPKIDNSECPELVSDEKVNDERWYYCISQTGLMAVPANGSVVLVDLQPSISPDGRWVC